MKLNKCIRSLFFFNKKMLTKNAFYSNDFRKRDIVFQVLYIYGCVAVINSVVFGSPLFFMIGIGFLVIVNLLGVTWGVSNDDEGNK